MIECGNDFVTQCVFIEHLLCSRAVLATEVTAVFKTMFLMSQSLHSNKEIDNGQVNKYKMCPAVMSSVEGKARGRGNAVVRE